MIAVFGATGQVGGKVAAMLLERGIPVRILVRSSERAAPLRNEGAEVVEGDMLNVDDVKNTLDRCDGAFMMTPVNIKSEHPVEDEIAIGKNYATALRNSTIAHVVHLSVAGARSSTGVPQFESKGVVESMLAASDVDVTYIRPSFFMENILNQGKLIREYGMMTLPIPADTPIPMVATEDVAYVMVESLVRGGRGCEQYEMYGQENYTPERVAQVLSNILAKDVRFKEASPEEMRHFATQAFGASPLAVENILKMFEVMRTMWRQWTPEMEDARWRVYNEFNFEPTSLETLLSTVSTAARSETAR